MEEEQSILLERLQVCSLVVTLGGFMQIQTLSSISL